MWQSLDQQKVLDTTDVMTGLADRVQYNTFGPIVGPNAKLLSNYIYQGPKNKVNTWLVKQMRAHSGHAPDLFTPDGFNIALMVCHAVQKANGDDVDKMISGARGLAVRRPEGRRADPQGGPRADPADVHRVARSSRRTATGRPSGSRRSRLGTSSRPSIHSRRPEP